MTKKVYKEGGGVFEETGVDIPMNNISFLHRKNTVTYSDYCIVPLMQDGKQE